MKKKKEEKYHAGKLRPIVQIVARMVQKKPELADNSDYLMACLIREIPELADKTHCPNCGTSLRIVTYTADLHDALLILAMARKVMENVANGMSFTEGNRVHMPSLQVSHTVMKRQTKCDYLGFVKQPDALRGTGYWVLTNWAWKALRGEQVPRSAYYWQGQKHGRSEETTTLGGMFKTHVDLVKKAAALRKSVRSDHVEEIGDYNPMDWSGFYGTKEGELF